MLKPNIVRNQNKSVWNLQMVSIKNLKVKLDGSVAGFLLEKWEIYQAGKDR